MNSASGNFSVRPPTPRPKPSAPAPPPLRPPPTGIPSAPFSTRRSQAKSRARCEFRRRSIPVAFPGRGILFSRRCLSRIPPGDSAIHRRFCAHSTASRAAPPVRAATGTWSWHSPAPSWPPSPPGRSVAIESHPLPSTLRRPPPILQPPPRQGPRAARPVQNHRPPPLLLLPPRQSPPPTIHPPPPRRPSLPSSSTPPSRRLLCDPGCSLARVRARSLSPSNLCSGHSTRSGLCPRDEALPAPF